MTPKTKADAGHDFELTRKDIAERIGKALAEEIEEHCIRIHERASKGAEASGIIIAGTKFEISFCDK